MRRKWKKTMAFALAFILVTALVKNDRIFVSAETSAESATDVSEPSETGLEGKGDGTDESGGSGSEDGTDEMGGSGSEDGSDGSGGSGGEDGTDEMGGSGSEDGTGEAGGSGSEDGTDEMGGSGSEDGTDEMGGSDSEDGTDEGDGSGGTEGADGESDSQGSSEEAGENGDEENTPITHIEGCDETCTAEDCQCPCHQEELPTEEVPEEEPETATFTVSFEIGEDAEKAGVESPEDIVLEEGEALEELPDPEWADEDGNPLMELTGWYTDEGCTEAFQAGTAVVEDVILYAGWAPVAVNAIMPVAANTEYDAVNCFDASGDDKSGNGHYEVLGVFIEENGDTHLIIGLLKNSSFKTVDGVKINEKEIISPETDQYTNPNDTVTVVIRGNGSKTFQGEKGLLVVHLGNNILEEMVGGTFRLSIDTDTAGDYSGNAWDVNNLPVEVDIDYYITKAVDKPAGEFQVSPGEELIYTITVRNDSEIALSGVDVTDTVPDGIEILSVNENTDIHISEENILTLDEDITLQCGESKTYKIAAKVKNDAQPGTVTNTATIGGALVPKEDTAEVEVIANKKVKITKLVTGNLGNPNKEFAFTATITSADGTPVTLTAPADGAYTVDAGTIRFGLVNEGSVEIEGIPMGATIVVTETEANQNGYKTTYRIGENELTAPEQGVTVNSDIEITVENHNEAKIDTGVLLDSMPYIFVLAVVAAAGIVWMGIRRRRRLD